MKLIEEEIKIKNLLLDMENPRFMIALGSSQEELIKAINSKREAITLKKSMKQEIRWVNKIVVRPDADRDKYIAVEGNMRLAVLKSGDIENYTEDKKIPVLIATQEAGESIQEYNETIRTIQGIANVMTVKEWSAVSKARHVYQMFLDKIENNNESPINAVRQVANIMFLSPSKKFLKVFCSNLNYAS